MTDLIRIDLRQAARSLARSPLFAVIAVLSLAFGIGGTTGAFSLVNALLLRPLPYADADRLVDVYQDHPTEVCAGCGVGSSYPDYLDIQRSATAFDGMAAYRTGQFTVGTSDGAERWAGAHVSASLFPLLGIDPLYGRAFSTEDDAAGAERVVVLGERLWRTRFDERADAVGRTLRVNGELHTIIGVMPDALSFPPFTELWLPLAPVAVGDARAERTIAVVARLAAGVTLAGARAQVSGIGAQLAQSYPESNAGWTAHVMPLRAEMASDYATSFFIMLGIVAFVLLVACANLANLLLARASARRQELAVRAALGATRRALVRHMLAESLLVSITAGALGLLVASWALDMFSTVTAGALPAWVRYDIDVRVALFAAAVAIGAGIVFGIIPALQAARVDPNRILTEGARGSTGGPTRTRTRNSFVAVQVAAAMVLVFGATILVAEFRRIVDWDAGYDFEGMYVGQVITAADRYGEPRAVQALAADVVERIGTSTGAEVVALSSTYVTNWPGLPAARVQAEGRTDADVADAIHRIYNVTSAYFATHGIRPLAGRDFQPSDGAGGPPVAIMGSKLAQHLWPGETAVGRQFRIAGVNDEWITVIGVVPSSRTSPFATDTARLLYLPLAQHAATQPHSHQLSLHMRFATTPASLPQRVRSGIALVDPDLVVENVRSRRDEYDRWIAPVRTTATAIAGLGLFGVLLAAMGIYGVVAFAVTQRIPELGIRMALGATRAEIARLVLSHALRLAAIGAAFGTMGAIALGGVLRSQFRGTVAGGPLTLLLLVLAFMGIALLASWLPTRRAAHIDPITALRAE